MMMMTIAEATSYQEAAGYQHRLQESGIEAIIRGHDPVEVVVDAQDADRARQVLSRS